MTQTNRRPHPTHEHARIPRDYRLFRPPFLADAIPQPSDADRAHDAFMDGLAARFVAAQRRMRDDRRQRDNHPGPAAS
ncbi:MAG: hypothetical protein EKK42_33155 [Pseudonocardiaceae bacterium]|nr:MAG: hypothetical protein EKK42_33155 [Pseudonocardiaceae bacterium]